jgi:hypothetical protein
MNLDDELRRALRRTPAPSGLADRVLRDRSAVPRASTWPWRRWIAAAAAGVLVATGGTRYYMHQQLVEAERIEAEVRLALEITHEKLQLVQRRINDSTSNEVGR